MPLRRIPASSRRNLAAIAFAAIAVGIGACSGNGTTSSSNQLLPKVKSDHSTPPPYTFTFAPVDYTLGGDQTRVNGIDERSAIVVGVSGTGPSSYSSWTAHTPLPLSTGFREFRTHDYPGASGTYMAAMSSGFYQAGTVFSPPPSGGLACNACGVVHYNQGIGSGYDGDKCGSTQCEWTFMVDPNEGSGQCAVTQVTGLGGLNMVVGYYQQGASSCGTQAFEGYYNSSGTYFADFSVPGADSNTTEATGMNEEGETVGVAQFNGHTAGWYYKEAEYCTDLSAPNSKATYPTGVNWQDQVVGYYVDSSQNTHGFMLLNPDAPASSQVWETVDDPLASGYTMVSHINTHHTITGWYKDASGGIHGFVGTCTSSNCNTGGSQVKRERHSGPHGTSGSSNCTPSGSFIWKRR